MRSSAVLQPHAARSLDLTEQRAASRQDGGKLLRGELQTNRVSRQRPRYLASYYGSPIVGLLECKSCSPCFSQ